MLRSILKYKLHWSISAIILISVSLFSAFQVNVKAAGLMVFAGRVTAQIPMPFCSNVYTCSACSLCGCGAWDQDIIAPIYGVNVTSSFFACKMVSYVPMGTGQLMVGSVVLGSCGTTHLSAWTPVVCNVWSMWQ